MRTQIDPRRAVELAVARLADRQGGVIAHEQLLAAGLSRAAIKRWVASGRLRPVHRGVFALGHVALTREGWWLAAALAHGPRAVLSHRTAAAAWGIRPPGGSRVDVSIPSRAGRVRRAGIALHRSGTLGPADVTRVDGLPLTTPARTLIDLAEVVGRRALRNALNETERLRLDVGDLDAVLDRHVGRHGAARVRAAVKALHVSDTWTRSAPERELRRLVEAADLPAPALNTSVLGLEVDALWPGHRVIVEVDGVEFHRTRQAVQDDHERTVALTLAGYRVLRFTDLQVERDPATVVAAIRQAIAATSLPAQTVRSRAISSKVAT